MSTEDALAILDAAAGKRFDSHVIAALRRYLGVPEPLAAKTPPAENYRTDG